MAGVSRHMMSRSLLSTARVVARFSGRTSSAAGSEAAASAGARGVMGGASSMPGASTRSASSNFSPKSFFEVRKPGAFFGRLPGEVACVQSLLPLHDATASARMVSQLRIAAGALVQVVASMETT